MHYEALGPPSNQKSILPIVTSLGCSTFREAVFTVLLLKVGKCLCAHLKCVVKMCTHKLDFATPHLVLLVY